MKQDTSYERTKQKYFRAVCYLLGAMILYAVGSETYYHYRRKALQREMEIRKVYKPIGLPNKSSVEKSDRVGDSDTSGIRAAAKTSPPLFDAETDRTHAETSTGGSGDDSEKSVPVSEGSVDSAGVETETQSPGSVSLKERLAETDALLEEANALLEESRASTIEFAPLLVDRLNSLSREEQVAVLEQTRSAFFKEKPSDADPAGIDAGWQLFLEVLTEHGYQPK